MQRRSEKSRQTEKIILWNKLTFVLLIIALAIILCQAGQILRLRKELKLSDSDVVGTYCTSVLPYEEMGYIVFRGNNGVCETYKQFGIIQEGYYQQNENVIIMTFHDTTIWAVYENPNLYVFAPGGINEVSFYTFHKTSDVPTYINVDRKS